MTCTFCFLSLCFRFCQFIFCILDTCKCEVGPVICNLHEELVITANSLNRCFTIALHILKLGLILWFYQMVYHVALHPWQKLHVAM